MSRLTVLRRTNLTGFPKAGELIEITGSYGLAASDRAIWNLLYQCAHDSGRKGEKDAEWEIPLGRLRPFTRAPIQGVTVAWWKRQGDVIVRERNRSKVERMARKALSKQRCHKLTH
jgi:hypothetical protein